MLITSIQRFAAAHTAEATTSTVDIPNDEMKGRIIGREGRNIRSFEKATGVDVIIDDTPGVVIVSAFDPVRREVARIALTKLIADGRIHPSRIEEIVAETEKEIEAKSAGMAKKRCRKSTSTASTAIVECSADFDFAPATARTCCGTRSRSRLSPGCWPRKWGSTASWPGAGLLHDIGKAADHDTEGGHPKIGADLLKRYGETPRSSTPRSAITTTFGPKCRTP